MSSPIRAILFDLDGTLIDSVEEIAAATNDWLTSMQYPAVSTTQVESWIGNGAPNLLRCAMQAVGANKADLTENFAARYDAFAEFYTARSGTLNTPFPEMIETLTALASQYQLGIVTNKKAAPTEQVLIGHDITDLFSVVVAGDTLAVRKPDPAPLNYALDQLGVAAENALFIGDSMTDLETGLAAAVETWVFTHGYHHGKFDNINVLEQPPARVLADFAELRKHLLS